LKGILVLFENNLAATRQFRRKSNREAPDRLPVVEHFLKEVWVVVAV
jgi:hypothetical protein